MVMALGYFASARSWKPRFMRSLGPFALAGAALTLSACIPGLLDGDDCNWSEERCLGEHTRQHCEDTDSSSNYWASYECDTEHPYCLQQLHSVGSGHSSAECVTEPHCSASTECANIGLCGDGPDHCLPTAEGCANSARCKSAGLCSAGVLECSATAEGCANSDACKLSGYCTLVEGQCTATAQSCAASTQCEIYGDCTLVEGKCKATAQSCAASTQCKISGACFLAAPTMPRPSGQNCEATAESCETSTDCAERGFCRLIGGRCVQ